MFSLCRETHGSGSVYHKELSKELAVFLEKSLQVLPIYVLTVDVHVHADLVSVSKVKV